MVLWKKESENADALYVNFFTSDEIDPDFTKHILTELGITGYEKNDDKATEFREKGNFNFGLKNWCEAMEMYNKSLRFATEKSENISLAYANRSACFLRIDKYNECLADIELARKANYPQRLMAKLDEREKACLKLMKDMIDRPKKEKPALSFDPDEKYPCMTNALEIKYNEEFGKHIVAKRDLEVGQVVLMEETFVSDATEFNQSCCKTCLQFAKNFIPCPNCTDVIFCDVKCMEANHIHKLACGVPYHLVENVTTFLDSIMIPVTAFSNADDLMKFVESALTTRDSTDTPECNSIIQSKYCLFLKLMTKSSKISKYQLETHSLVFWMLGGIPEIKHRFDTQPKRRFLMHLILQHIFILESNSYAYHTVGPGKKTFIQMMSIFSSLFNHSCYPNVTFIRFGNEMVSYIVRPVKEGEQLFIRYISEPKPTEERRAFLRKESNFECMCEKCVPCFKQEDRLQMQSDPNYRIILKYNNTNVANDLVRDILKGKCHEFLCKYGRLPWSEEIDIVLRRFNRSLDEEFAEFLV